jgi:hypothetical protein
MSLDKKVFMLKKILRDLKSPEKPYELSNDVFSQNITQYYFVFKEQRVAAGKDQALIKKFDENGIPINKTYIDVTDKEYVYFPISIGQMGLSVFHTYLQSKKDEDKQRFLKFCDWFDKNAETSSHLGVRWLTDVSLPQYKNKGPWQSAFSQSRGISILLRGYQLTGNEKWLELATKALIPFTVPVDKGGVTSFTQWGPFYEEYTASIPTLVLNGKIFALCGVHEYYRAFPDNKTAKKIFDEGIQTLENILPQYDLGFWSKYNLCEADWYPEIDPATVGYQHLHIIQLEMLHKLTQREIFNQYAALFKKQDTTRNALKMYKIKYKALKKIGRL